MDGDLLQDEMEEFLKRKEEEVAEVESETEELSDAMSIIRKKREARKKKEEETEQAETEEKESDALSVIRKRREARQKQAAEGEVEETPEAGEVSDALSVIRKRREAREKQAEDKESEEKAPVEEAPDEEGRFYVVEKGDSLWKIAEKVYGDGSRWKEIRKANKDIIEDPKIIRKGWKLRIP